MRVHRFLPVIQVAVALPLAAQSLARGASLVTYRIAPSAVDPSVHRFDEPHFIVFDSTARADAPLLLFLPGTGGRPQNASEFLIAGARQGYRVIGLEYVDTPAVQQICPRNPDPDCADKVRRKRIYGDDATSLVDDRPEESIATRLTKLLLALDRDHPGQGWSRYLKDGKLDWTQIAVSGLSQGAGKRMQKTGRALCVDSGSRGPVAGKIPRRGGKPPAGWPTRDGLALS